MLERASRRKHGVEQEDRMPVELARHGMQIGFRLEGLFVSAHPEEADFCHRQQCKGRVEHPESGAQNGNDQRWTIDIDAGGRSERGLHLHGPCRHVACGFVDQEERKLLEHSPKRDRAGFLVSEASEAFASKRVVGNDDLHEHRSSATGIPFKGSSLASDKPPAKLGFGSMLKIFVAVLIAISIGLAGCTRRTPKTPTLEPTADSVQPPGKADEAPRLVVLIVVDQLAAWVLDIYLPILPSDSVLRRAHEQGAYHRAAFPYASTQTAPGHASLTTGVPPSMHGIAANAVFDPAHGARKTVDDRKHAVIGNPERFVSPTALQAPTVADALHQHSDGKARIVGISMKGRSAVLSVGQKPNAVVFYDSKARSMTTSTFYAPSGKRPDWLNAFVKANPVEPLLQIWEPGNRAWLESKLGPDAWQGEMYPSFPHDPKATTNPWYAFSFTPESTEYLIAAAFAAVKAEDMGVDEVPDFLVLGISGTDIVGHIWGPRSWEYADNLLRTDQALGRFVRILEARGPVAFVLTADHGIAAMPERVRAEGGDAGRLSHTQVTEHAERAADEALGEGDWIAAYVPPFITYTEAGRQRRKELRKALMKAMPKLEGVRAVYDAHEGTKLRASSRDIERLVGASLPKDPPGDLYMVTREGWFDALAEQGGTNHGTPWPYDRQVPILMWGAGIERRTSQKVHSVLEVANTLCVLLDIPPLTLAPQSPLPGVMRLHD